MTFKFIQEYKDFDGRMVQTVTFEMPQDSTLPEVVEGFESFLKGAGYQLEGYLDIVPHQEEEPLRYERATPEWYKNNLNKEAMYTGPMPGTMGGATYTFKEEAGKCGRCGLTSEQLGGHKCYDVHCGMK